MDDAITAAGNMFNQLKNSVGGVVNQVGSDINSVVSNLNKPVTAPDIGTSTPNWQQPQQLSSDVFGQQAPITMALQGNYQQIGPRMNQLFQQGLSNPMNMGLVGGIGAEAPAANNAIKLLRNKLMPEDVDLLGRFSEIHDIQGPRANFGEVGQQVQSLAQNVFGDQAANWSNTKLKNVFDLVLGKIGQVSNKAGLGLAVQSIRDDGLLPFGELKGIEPEANQKLQEIMPQIQQNTAAHEMDIKGMNQDVGGVLAPPEPPGISGGQATEVPNMGQVGQQVRSARFAESQKVTGSAEPLVSQASSVLQGNDNNLFRTAMQHPEQLDALSQQASNPEQFKALAQQASTFFDRIANLASKNKVQMGFVNDYFPQIWDLSSKESQETFKNLMNSTNFTSGFTKEKIFQTIEQGQAAGLQLKNPNVAQDIVQYANSMAMQIGQQAATNKANQLIPNSMIDMRQAGGIPPRDYAGKPYVQSPVPGQAATFVSPDLAKQLNYYNPSAFANNPIVKVLDNINTALKETKLGGGLFHAYRESVNYIGSSLFAQGRVPRLDVAGRAFVDKGFWNQKMQDFVNRGVLDDASNMGITVSRIQDIGKEGETTLGKANSLNPLTALKTATFGRLINYYKLNTVDHLPQAMRTPEVGKQIEALYNGVNSEVAGTNKTLSQLGRFGFLAAQFNVGKLVNIGKAAVGGNNPASNFARASILGTVVSTAVGAEVLRKVMTGSFSPDVKSFLANSILNPSVPLPYKSPTGKNLQMGIPGTDVSDIAKALPMKIAGVQGDPGHFITARAGPALSLANQVATGKDYYGNPLVNPYGDQGIKGQVKAAGQVALAQAPIPVVQIAKVLQGKQTVTTAALNTLGFRVHNDPNDPIMKYFSDLKTASDSLNPNDRNTFLSLHPTTKDSEGNPVVDKSLSMTSEKYDTLLHNPAVMAAESAFQKSQASHDPIWDLSPAQRNEVMAAAVHLPGQKSTYQAAIANQPWYQQFQQQRSQFYSNLPQQQQPQNTIPQFLQPFANALGFTGQQQQPQQPAAGVPRPQPSNYVQQQMNAKNWSDPQVQAYLNANTAYNNDQLAKMGLPAIPASTGITASQRRSISSRLPIKSGGGGSTKLKSATSKSSYKTGKTAGIKIPKTPTMAKGKAPKGVHVSVKTPKVMTAKVKTAKLKTQAFKIPPIQKINMKFIGRHFTPARGKYVYQ